MWTEILRAVLNGPLAVLTIAIWGGLVSVICRSFGVSLPIRVWIPAYSAAVMKLTRLKTIVIEGVLFWGLGVYWTGVVWEYVDTKLGLPARDASDYSIVFAIAWMIAGGFYGWTFWKHFRANPYARYDRLSISPETRMSHSAPYNNVSGNSEAL